MQNESPETNFTGYGGGCPCLAIIEPTGGRLLTKTGIQIPKMLLRKLYIYPYVGAEVKERQGFRRR
jgi:hypothetical protein